MPQMSQSRNAKLSTLTKILYGAGDIGFSLTDTTIGVLFAIFLTDVVGLSPGLAAVAIFLGRSWDYLNDPIIGHFSDRTRTRWGRRRPFLLFGFIPFGVAFALMWWKPPLESATALAIYYGLAYLLYDTTATLVYMPYYCLTPELTEDYDERTTLTSYRMAFSILGGLIAFTVPLAVIGAMAPENADRVFGVGTALAAISAFPLLLTFLGTHERPEYLAQPRPNLSQSLRAALKNRPFIFASGIFLFTWTAIEVIQAILLFFLKYYLRLEAQMDLIAATVFIIALFTLPFWEKASRIWDKRLTYIAGMIFLSAVLTTLTFINPDWGFPVVMSLAALAGVGVGAIHVLPWAIIPDAIEWDELATGQRHEGMFYSLVTLLRKISSSVAVPLTLVALERSGYVSNAPEQAASAIHAIQTLMGPIPSLLLACGILFALFYPLGRERHAQIRAELASRRTH